MRSRTPKERQLQRDALAYEERYFKDLTLHSKRMQKRLGAHEIQTEDGGWMEASSEFPQPTVAGWIFRYRRFRDEKYGLCDYRIKTIFIHDGMEPQVHKGTILHEMLHAYEFQLYPMLREWLLLDLWEDLKRNKIVEKKLRRFVDRNTHSLLEVSGHGVLFLLKCLDLDLRNKWEFGTTFAYGREELLRT
ncbi:MAG: hypothetical protein IID45_14015 [Planctomycetes bacterium]|nr:hypothetical protein [Planctomycetota bacterium]